MTIITMIAIAYRRRQHHHPHLRDAERSRNTGALEVNVIQNPNRASWAMQDIIAIASPSWGQIGAILGHGKAVVTTNCLAHDHHGQHELRSTSAGRSAYMALQMIPVDTPS